MAVRKCIFEEVHREEIKKRILSVKEHSERKWGKMNASQMLQHCDIILQIGQGRMVLPKIHMVLRCIGIVTKYELRIFNNGILPNMPTFKQVIVAENCNFEEAKAALLLTLEEFAGISESHKLPAKHALFGKMTKKDWGFLQYKHLNHHLKQFGV